MHIISIHEDRRSVTTYNYNVSQDPVLRETVVGLRANIEPPLSLNSDAIRTYVETGGLEGNDSGTGSFQTVALLGNTAEASVIYAVVNPGDEQTRRKKLLAERVSGYLGLMGLSSEVHDPQYPTD